MVHYNKQGGVNYGSKNSKCNSKNSTGYQNIIIAYEPIWAIGTGKTATKEQAEEILERLGIPVSVFIDMAYRQVIMRGGVPFSLDIPDTLATRDSLTKAEFDTMMQTGFIQAKKDDSVSVEEAFEQLKAEI